MKTTNWIETKETTSGKATVNNGSVGTEENVCQNYYGRSYNEEVPFTQANFQAYQDILNKRNELLGSVKHTYSI